MRDRPHPPLRDLTAELLDAALAAAMVTIGDRVAWPSVVRYTYDDAEHPLPPAAPAPYGIRVIDLRLCERLAILGYLGIPAHRGGAA